MSPLEQDITWNKQVNKLLEPEPELDIRKDMQNKVEAIKDSAFYINKTAKGQLLGLYYQVS